MLLSSSATAKQNDTSADSVDVMKVTVSKQRHQSDQGLLCVDCGEQFKDWRVLQQHKRRFCRKVERFLCRQCRAVFHSWPELSSHCLTAHQTKCHGSSQDSLLSDCDSSSKSCQDHKLETANKSGKNVQLSKLVPEKSCSPNTQQNGLNDSKKQSVYKVGKPVQTKKYFTVRMKQMQLKQRMLAVKAYTVGENPFCFTTSCAPDADAFQFLCQSCLTVRFPTYAGLRQHEEWCGWIKSGAGTVCSYCSRYYRNAVVLRRHIEEFHEAAPGDGVLKKPTGANSYRFSTTVARDASDHEHICSSCSVICFNEIGSLRRHEDWCGQSVKPDGKLRCRKCRRYFRTTELLTRHQAAGVDCRKTVSKGDPDDCIKPSTETGTVTTENKVVPKKEVPVCETAPFVLSTCPLCDMPLTTKYEQQFHLVTVHKLPSSAQVAKPWLSRQAEMGWNRAPVMCLTCCKRFPGRLELAEHKRDCCVEDESVSTSSASQKLMPTAVKKSRNSHKPSKNPSKVVGKEQTADIACASNSEAKPGGIASTSQLSSTGSGENLSATQTLLKSPQVRYLIEQTGAKKLLLKPDGELLLMNAAGKIITQVVMKAARASPASIPEPDSNSDEVQSKDPEAEKSGDGKDTSVRSAKCSLADSCQLPTDHSHTKSTKKLHTSSLLKRNTSANSRTTDAAVLSRKRSRSPANSSSTKRRLLSQTVDTTSSTVVSDLGHSATSRSAQPSMKRRKLHLEHQRPPNSEASRQSRTRSTIQKTTSEISPASEAPKLRHSSNADISTKPSGQFRPNKHDVITRVSARQRTNRSSV